MRMSVIIDSYHIGMARPTIGDHRRSLPFLLHPPHCRRLSRPSPSPTRLHLLLVSDLIPQKQSFIFSLLAFFCSPPYDSYPTIRWRLEEFLEVDEFASDRGRLTICRLATFEITTIEYKYSHTAIEKGPVDLNLSLARLGVSQSANRDLSAVPEYHQPQS